LPLSNIFKGFVAAYHDILSHAGSSYRQILQHISTLHPGNIGNSNSAILIHCTAGKDRTGLFIALLLSLLGATDEAISTEYHLTDLGLKEALPGFVKGVVGRLEEFEKLGSAQGERTEDAGRIREHVEGQHHDRVDAEEQRGSVLSKVSQDHTQDRTDRNVLNAPDTLTKTETESERQRRYTRLAERCVSARKESMLATLQMVKQEWGGAMSYFLEVCELDTFTLEKVKENLTVHVDVSDDGGGTANLGARI
jgi:hypothetical protein